ncbi:hypothetical protein CHH28_14430 [Bacterioplanes sanyensis]|uniref:Uncharacterized protein n=1 Tax=Bacterioplanes sanyensis TaxID=1249553 RepID=A0A222FNK3_9GAMM|nr:hypothetical protein [Bacterioplanes sanyensis]ASP39793.1 hypothetical protein CHH28_14430 [Bacterioplanes sanyensis]
MATEYTLQKIMNAPADSYVVIHGKRYEVFILGLFQGEYGDSFVDAVFPLDDVQLGDQATPSRPARLQEGFEGLSIGGQYWKKYDRKASVEGAGKMPFLVF